MQADSVKAGQSIKDPLKFKPAVVRSAEQFNQLLEHFRKNGHRWPTSKIHGSMCKSLYTMTSYEQFERWIFETQRTYDGLETLPERT